MDFYPKVNRAMVGNSVNVFVGLAELLLALRVVLKFFFTTASGSFFHWAYSTTDVLLTPFRAVFSNPTQASGQGWYIDWVALFAMALYMAGGYLLIGLINRWVRK